MRLFQVFYLIHSDRHLKPREKAFEWVPAKTGKKARKKLKQRIRQRYLDAPRLIIKTSLTDSLQHF